jgi:general secretion pathway protein A
MVFLLKKKKISKPSPCDPKMNLFWQQLNYNKFYGLSRDPFDPQPDPRLIFLTENVREVWNSIVSGIDQRKGFLLLTGEKGMGKTTLISLIYLYLATNGRKVKVIPLFDSSRKMEEILQTLARGLGLPSKRERKSPMLCRLYENLAQRSEGGETFALIIDEAQNLRRETLEEFRLLANPSPKRPSLVQEIFVGDIQFEKNLSSGGLMSLNQRFEVRCRLRPFTPEESLGYIEHRLKRAGSTTSRVFTPRAVSLITQTSGGNPGALTRICQESLSMGYSKLKKKIDSASVREAIANLGMENGRGRHLHWKTLPWIRRVLGES